MTVKAYAGTTGVVLALDVEEKHRHACSGCLQREGGNRPREWLQGLLQFPGVKHGKGELVDTNVAPVQKFRWSDYRVYPGTSYAYTVHPVYGDPAKPSGLEAGPTVTAVTASADQGEHRISSTGRRRRQPGVQPRLPEVDEELEAARDKRDRCCRRGRWPGSAAARSSRSPASAPAPSTRPGRSTSASTNSSCRRSSRRSTPPANAAPRCGSSTTPSPATTGPNATRRAWSAGRRRASVPASPRRSATTSSSS